MTEDLYKSDEVLTQVSQNSIQRQFTSEVVDEDMDSYIEETP